MGVPHVQLRPLLVLLTLLGPATASAQAVPVEPGVSDPLVPDSVLHAPGFPRIVRLPAPAPGVVTLRLSIPLVESPAEAGAGRLIETLAHARVEGPASTLGARLETGRTPWGIVYTVTGPAADLDHLVFLLREATRAPTVDEGVLRRERLELEERLRRLEETGGGRVEAQLRATATAGEAPIDGTRGTLPRLSGAVLRDVWARSHHPEGMTLLVLGEVADPVLLATIAGLGAEPGLAAPPPLAGPAPAAPAPADVETLRQWHGRAWSSAGPLDPRAALVAVLLSRHLRDDDRSYEAQIRLWETDGHTVVAAIGAAYPAQAGALRTRLDRMLTTTASELGEAEVRDVAETARRDLLLQARTPWGRAHLVGRFLDAGLGPGAAREYVDRLGALDLATVRAFIDQLAATPAARAEVRP